MLRIAGIAVLATVLVGSAAAQDLPPGLPPGIDPTPVPIPEPEPEPLPTPEPAPEPDRCDKARNDSSKLPKLGRRIKSIADRDGGERLTGKQRRDAVKAEIRSHRDRIKERKRERREARQRRKDCRRRR